MMFYGDEFEKDAKDYVNAAFCRVKAGLEEISIEAAMQTFIDGAELGYVKANKWHYPSKGDLPEKGVRLLCYTGDVWCHNQDYTEKHTPIEMGTYTKKGEWFISCYHTCNAPIAWMYLPEPPEENHK